MVKNIFSHRTTGDEEEGGDQRPKRSGRRAHWDLQEVYYVTVGKKPGEAQLPGAEVRDTAGEIAGLPQSLWYFVNLFYFILFL